MRERCDNRVGGSNTNLNNMKAEITEVEQKQDSFIIQCTEKPEQKPFQAFTVNVPRDWKFLTMDISSRCDLRIWYKSGMLSRMTRFSEEDNTIFIEVRMALLFEGTIIHRENDKETYLGSARSMGRVYHLFLLEDALPPINTNLATDNVSKN